ncbi:MAG: hypothetical protein ACPGJV_13270 [Bacteriovoracaceae bacterium]
MLDQNIIIYTIGLKDLSLNDSLSWASSHGITALKLRACERGYNLKDLKQIKLSQIRKNFLRQNVQIHSIATNIELEDLLKNDSNQDFKKYQLVSETLNCPKIRILSKKKDTSWENQNFKFLKNCKSKEILVELHSSESFKSKELMTLFASMKKNKHFRVLFDFFQVSSHYSSFQKNKKPFLYFSRLIHIDPDDVNLNKESHIDILTSLRDHSVNYQICLENWRTPNSSDTLKKYFKLKKLIHEIKEL